MTQKRTWIVLLSICLVIALTGCSSHSHSDETLANTQHHTSNASAQNVDTNTESTTHKIGVAVYNLTDDEVNMFRRYYEDYLKDIFSVDFLYSSSISNIAEEKAFVDTAKAQGCEGIISFVTYDLPEILNYCGNDLYYVMGSGTVSADDYNQVKDNDHFLGIIGPTEKNEKQSAVNMINALADDNGKQKTYLLLSGGSAQNNYMHSQRLKGMLDTLVQDYEFTLEKSEEELLAAQETILAAQHSDGGKVYICPGYYYTNFDKVTAALTETQPDVVASVCAVYMLSDTIAAQETTQNKNIQVGTIDCFSENNQTAFETKDKFGNSSLDYLEGKCQAMSAPAFIAMYNAVTSHIETVRNNGEAFWLHQDLWHAASAQEYETLRATADNIYQNIYSSDELMKVTNTYNDTANYQTFKELVAHIEEN